LRLFAPEWKPVNDIPSARALADGGTWRATMLLIEGSATPSPKPCASPQHLHHPEGCVSGSWIRNSRFGSLLAHMQTIQYYYHSEAGWHCCLLAKETSSVARTATCC
jgi:hypothetical protein